MHVHYFLFRAAELGETATFSPCLIFVAVGCKLISFPIYIHLQHTNWGFFKKGLFKKEHVFSSIDPQTFQVFSETLGENNYIQIWVLCSLLEISLKTQLLKAIPVCGSVLVSPWEGSAGLLNFSPWITSVAYGTFLTCSLWILLEQLPQAFHGFHPRNNTKEQSLWQGNTAIYILW